MENIVSRYLVDLKEHNDTDWVNTHIGADFHREFKKQLKSRDLKRYIYMATFTIDPSKHPEVTPELTNEITDFIESQAKRTALRLKKFTYVQEEHKDGRPHWHVLIETTKALKKDRFNHFIKKYGNLDLAKNKAQQTDEIMNYISKVGLPKTLL